MAFKPQVRYNPSLSMEDNLKAITNWMNFLLREMSVGRVPQNQKETKSIQLHQMEQDETLALVDETAIELFENQMIQEEKIKELFDKTGGVE